MDNSDLNCQNIEKFFGKLRPCPFCGSKEIEQEAVSGVLYLRCQKCSCAGGQIFTNNREWIDVVYKWNTRITDPRPETFHKPDC